MTANPYVADVEAPSWHSGTGLVDDVVSLSQDLSSGSWVAAGLDAFGTAVDVAATVSDPLGSAIAAGIGFILDHLDPLKSWLDDLTGNPGQVQANAATYGNVAQGLSTEVDTLGRLVSRDLEGQSGQLIAAYEAKMASIQQSLAALSEAAGATSTAMGIAGTIVQVVHDMVRDAISQIVGSAISYAAELICTLGAATPLVIEQVTTRVSELATKIGTDVKNVVKSADSLKDLMTNLDKAVKDLEGGLKDIDLPKGAEVPGPRRAGEEDLPDIDLSDAPPPPQGLDRLPDDPEVLKWVDDMHEKYPELSKDEIHGIWDYTTNTGYDDMNGALRSSGETPPDVQARIDNAVSGLDKLPKHEGVTYRGTNLPDHVVQEIERTGTYHDPAFSSSSSNPAVANSFVHGGDNPTVMTIHGHSSTDVHPFSAAQRESEYLFKPGVKFDVVTNKVVPEMEVNGRMMQNVRVLELREPR